MANRRGPNPILNDGGVTTLLVRHKHRTYRVLIDSEDYPLISAHRWSIGNTNVGSRKAPYLVVATSRWSPGNGQETVRLARMILGAPQGLQVDHVNGDTLDNRRQNLRLATQVQNQQNIRGPRVFNRSTGVLNVSLDSGGLYQVRIQNNGKTLRLGRFQSIAEAAIVAQQARAGLLPFSREARACDSSGK